MAIKTVLCVDDSSTDLKQLEQIVSDAGYTAVTATSGQEAVEKAKSKKPDAVLMDVIMEPMNGFQACRTITSDTSIPVVLISSKGEKTDKMWAKEQGAKGYVTKPYTPDQVLDELKAL